MRTSRIQQWLPLVYFAAALLLVVFALPTILRPPAPSPPGTPELSPDAPPDENDQSIVASLGRAVSGTAGASTEGAGPASDPGPGSGGSIGAPAATPSACSRGFGEPRRQVESVYAAPCAKPFSGTNGGATWRGVTDNEVRVVVAYRGGDTALKEGPVASEPETGESAPNRTLRVFQNYFNQSFQTYGRQLRLHALKLPTNSDAQTAVAAAAAEEAKAFASVQLGGAGVPYNNEANRRGLVTFNELQFADDFYTSKAPLAYNWSFGLTTALRLSAEYLCKKMAGRPAEFAGSDVVGQTRKLGIIYYSEPGAFERTGDDMGRLLNEHCGEQLAVSVGYDLRDTDNLAQQIATAMTRMRQEGVTTIIYAAASVQLPQFTAQADQLAYQPEWWLAGLDRVDSAELARRATPSQWRHAFGLSLNELPRPEEELDAARAYRLIDPSGAPDANTIPAFYGLLQLMNGVQMAGPRLTPTTFQSGLHAIRKRPPDPVWSAGGGYAPGDPTYAEYAAEMWWDGTADDPASDQPGAYRFLNGGRRFTFGQLSDEAPRMFRDGITTA